jgi:hypothetical protein
MARLKLTAMQDVFVMRCAKVFQRHLGLTDDEAIYEATLMATTDTLYESELTSIDPEENCVKLDLEPTFPLNKQSEGTP